MSDQPSTAQSNRYLIYTLLRRKVSFQSLRKPGRLWVGMVEGVSRDVFSNEIIIQMSGKVFRFREPTMIQADGNDVVLVYGQKEDVEKESDEELFREMRDGQYKETFSDIIHRTEPVRQKEVRFSVGEPEVKRRKWKRSK